VLLTAMAQNLGRLDKLLSRAPPKTDRPREGSNSLQNTQRSYERYLELAQAEIRACNIVGAKNYHQHAEHYFRLMSPAPETR
jgi:hypothetical protein